MTEDELLALIVEHTDGWNSHDLDRLMGLFADGCVFEASGGPQVQGQQFRGIGEVRSAFAEVFERMPDARWGDGRHFVLDHQHGLSQWTLTGTLADGSRVEVNGCDILTVSDGRITRKDSYRKQRPPVPQP